MREDQAGKLSGDVVGNDGVVLGKINAVAYTFGILHHLVISVILVPTILVIALLSVLLVSDAGPLNKRSPKGRAQLSLLY